MNDFEHFKKEHQELNDQLSFVNKSVEDYSDDIDLILKGEYVKPISTGVDELDNHFNMFLGMLLLVTGYPQSGKSEFVRFLACFHACQKRGKVNIFSPESDMPLLTTEIITTVKHILGTDWNTARDFTHEWFKFKEIKDDTGMPDIQDLIDDFSMLSNDGYNFFVVDPMNWVTSSMYTNTGMFESLRLTLTQMKQFAKRHKVIMCYVEHPKTPMPNKDGVIPMCSIFTVNGGVMHNNKVDGALILHRQRQIDDHGKPKSSSSDPVLLEVAKLKFQKYLGTPDNLLMHYDYKTGMYQSWESRNRPKEPKQTEYLKFPEVDRGSDFQINI